MPQPGRNAGIMESRRDHGICTRVYACMSIYTYINVLQYAQIDLDIRQRISAPGHGEAFSRRAIYILFVHLGEMSGKTGGYAPATRAPPRTHTRSQTVPTVPLNPRCSGHRCGIQAPLARAAGQGAAARRVLRTSPDAQRFLTDRPPPRGSIASFSSPSPVPALYQKPPSLSRGARRRPHAPVRPCALCPAEGHRGTPGTPSRIPSRPRGPAPTAAPLGRGAGQGGTHLTMTYMTKKLPKSPTTQTTE